MLLVLISRNIQQLFGDKHETMDTASKMKIHWGK